MKKINLLLGATLFLALVGCDLKETIEQVTTPTEAAEALQEYILVNQQFQDASNSSDQAQIEGEISLSGNLKSTLEGPSITVSPADFTSFPKTYTIDFGERTVGQDGIVRSGKMIITASNWYKEVGSTHLTNYENFYQNGHKIEGTKTTTNLGYNDMQKLVYAVIIEEGKITTPEGGVIMFEQDTERTWQEGDDTPLNLWDDEYLFDGVQTGISSKNVDYTLDISTPLHFVMETKELKAGKLIVSIGSFSGIEIDYAAKTITIAGVSYPFES